MKKFLIFLAITSVPAIGVLVYSYWWAYRKFDEQQ